MGAELRSLRKRVSGNDISGTVIGLYGSYQAVYGMPFGFGQDGYAVLAGGVGGTGSDGKSTNLVQQAFPAGLAEGLMEVAYRG